MSGTRLLPWAPPVTIHEHELRRVGLTVWHVVDSDGTKLCECEDYNQARAIVRALNEWGAS